MNTNNNKVINISVVDSLKQIDNLYELLSSSEDNVQFTVASLQKMIDNISTRARAQGAFRKKDMEYIRQIISIVTRYQDTTADALNLTISFNSDEGTKLVGDKNI